MKMREDDSEECSTQQATDRKISAKKRKGTEEEKGGVTKGLAGEEKVSVPLQYDTSV